MRDDIPVLCLDDKPEVEYYVLYWGPYFPRQMYKLDKQKGKKKLKPYNVRNV